MNEELDNLLNIHLNEIKAGHDGKLKEGIIKLMTEARIEALKTAHKCVDDTVMWIKKDIVSLLSHDEAYAIRKQHKKEIHANIDKAIAALKAQSGGEEK